MKLIKKPKHYFIRWADTESWTNWHDDDEVIERIKSENYWVDMAGWILYEDKRFIIIATKHSRGGYWSNVYKIPTTWIGKRRIIK